MRTCPFCNYDEDWVKEAIYQKPIKYRVECAVCGATGPLANTYELAEKNMVSFPGLKTTEIDLENWEKDFLGYNFFTSKFTKEIFDKVDDMKIPYYKRMSEIKYPKPALIQITLLRIFNDKNNNEMAFATISDEFGQTTRIPLFASVWKYIKDYIKQNEIYLAILRNDNDQIMFGKGSYLTEQEIKKSLLKIS